MMCLGMLMPIPDTRVGATSLPTIQRAWNIAPDEMSWIRAFAMTLGTLSVGKDPQCDDNGDSGSSEWLDWLNYLLIGL